jgi:hypothetical protein
MLDKLATFSDDQAITATDVSDGKVYVMPYTGRGEYVNVHIQVTESFDNLTSLTVQVAQADTEDGSYEVVDNGITIPLASLVTGFKVPVRVLPQVSKEWLELQYTVTGTAPTAGKISAFIVEGEDLPITDGLYISPRNPTGDKTTA